MNTNTISHLMNRVDGWQQPVNPETGASQGIFKRHILSRAVTFAAGVSTELAEAAKNALIAPFQAVGGVLKIGAKGISMLTCSEDGICKKIEGKLPSLKDFFNTVAKVVGFVAGAFLTATVGLASPKLNFDLQCAMGLVENKKEEALKVALEEELAKKQAEEIALREAVASKIAQQNAEALAELNKQATVFEIANKLEAESRDENVEAARDMLIQAESEAAKVSVPEVVIEEQLEVEMSAQQPTQSTISWMINNVANGAKSVGRFVTAGYLFNNEEAKA